MAQEIPVLRILGGVFFVLAGLAYFLAFTIPYSLALLFVAAGAAVVLVAILGHRPSGGDVAVFVIGLLVLGVLTTPGVAYPGGEAGEKVTYTVSASALTAQQVELLVHTDVGSVSVSHLANSAAGYQVNFTRSAFPFSIFSGISPLASLTNETRGGIFTLNATSRGYSVSVAVGDSYLLNVTASTGTGSIDFNGSPAGRLGDVSLESGTGSVSANITSQSVGAVSLQTGTGSVELRSSHLASNGAMVPITLSTGTGGATLDVSLAGGTAVSLEATAGLGGVNHNLQGFTVSPESTRSSLFATAGEPGSAPSSFVVRISTGTGSVTADARFLG